nr:GUN4 domain-containing protein [Phormidium sp. FACHB-592]
MPEKSVSEEAIKIFYSYSRKDLDMRNTLEDHLSALREAKRIETWHDLELEAGTEWEPAILHKLDTADIILLLISRSFIASKYCYGTELKRAIARHDAGTARVIPIILRFCDWNHDYVPFSKLNVLPTHATPITKWEDRDEAFAIVAQRIRETVDQLRDQKQAARQMQQMPIHEKQFQEEEQSRHAFFVQDDLSSERGVDYRKLQSLLKGQRWGEADLETLESMFVATGNKKGALETEDITCFPCTDLQTINNLWTKYSNHRFGFSVQKKIYLECGGKPDYRIDERVEEKFGKKVGWKNQKTWLFYPDLVFDNEAPFGQFPVFAYLDFWYTVESGDEAIGWVPSHLSLLMQKIIRCNIQ